MYTRFGTIQVKPGQVDEFVRIFRDEMVPPTRKLQGFKGVTVLADPETHTVTAMSFWETEVDARAVEASSGSFQTQVDKVAALIDKAPATQYLEVRYQES